MRRWNVARKEGKIMRRIISACLLQTVRFDTVSGADPEKDFQVYCHKLERKGQKYQIEGTEKESDGALVVKIKKQYNTYKTEGYLE